MTDADTGAPLAGTVVELPDLVRVAVTDDAGRYELQRVASGPQHLIARMLAYGEPTLHALVPGTGTLVIDVALHPAPRPEPHSAANNTTGPPVRAAFA